MLDATAVAAKPITRKRGRPRGTKRVRPPKRPRKLYTRRKKGKTEEIERTLICEGEEGEEETVNLEPDEIQVLSNFTCDLNSPPPIEIVPPDVGPILSTVPYIEDPYLNAWVQQVIRGWRGALERAAILEIRNYFLQEKLTLNEAMLSISTPPIDL